MKILSVGNFTTGWDGSICDEEHIAKALEQQGHYVVRGQRESLFQNLIPESVFDFILIAQWDNYIPDMVPKLRGMLKPGGRIAYWAFDYQPPGQPWHDRLIGEVDIYFSKPFADAQYPNWKWLSQDFAPDFLMAEPHLPESEKDIEVLFTGSWVPWPSAQARVDILKAIDERFDLHIYGVTPDDWKREGFKNVHGPAMDHQLPNLINRAKINFSMDHTYAAGYWSDRNAQIMACGGFVLFRHVPFSEAIFGDNIAYFYNTEDCLKKIEKYLANPTAREAVAHHGKVYALNKMMAYNRTYEMMIAAGGAF